MNRKPIDASMKWLGIAFASYVGSCAILIAFAFMNVGEPIASIMAVVALVGFVGGALLYLICLGNVASRTGRSAITWVGLTFLLSPVSYFFAYPMLKSRVDKETKQLSVS